jgi:putative transposase
VWQQILRASKEKRMAVVAYCFMPDHLHLIVTGEDDESDCKAFIKAAKQYSSYGHKAAHGRKLWERYGHDRVLRDEVEFCMALLYLVSNPVKDGLVKDPHDYPFWGSEKYTREELTKWCDAIEADLA